MNKWFGNSKKIILFIITALLISMLNAPAALAEEVNEDFYHDVLSHAKTPLLNTIESRMENINLTCGIINETIVLPNAIFSFNEVVGNRTEERGFKLAPTFMDGKIADSLGGGICQVSSTLYYACLLADLEIVERRSHSMLPDYVSLPGYDATVFWDSIDYKFKNNGGFPLKLLTWVEDTEVQVKILGTKQNNHTVSIESEIISEVPAGTIYIDNPNLADGQVNILQPSFTGYTVNTYRKIVNEQGELISLTFEAKSTYNKLDGIVEYKAG
ncbi:MAG: VanW family protein [Lachnospiraceae bacterium]|nr:VanW family protein [Lachnospiraceae bacterium]